ncbi:hypothetical protein Ah1_00152 [Aeromonas phage Ah1]|uniref:Lipoprotein n=1 Tax=Aeromonas phage Ah1 TaxID=2053701 RepID=A0A2H4YEV1_9CAUD|nr:hypothetical protein KNT77_gp152 [Aeromonas phage Ah1]AUE22693.1 hypothetical protein Ah1_00152 [Aeromonas phage Ah1]
MFRVMFLVFVVLLSGCGEPEKPIVVREVTAQATRYKPEEWRGKFYQAARVEFEYNGILVYSIETGSCTIVPEFKQETVVLMKAVYSSGIKYYIKDDSYQANFLAKYCY